jgi:hypothetical protein
MADGTIPLACPKITIFEDGNYTHGVTGPNGHDVTFVVAKYPKLDGIQMNHCSVVLTVSWSFVPDENPHVVGGGTIKVGS